MKPSFGRADPYTPALPSPLAAIIARNEGDSRSDYRLRTKLNVKVLDFVQLGGAYPTLYLLGFSTPSDVPFSLTTYRCYHLVWAAL